MPWQGNKEIKIDRFDGRAHLDLIADCPTDIKDPENETTRENRDINYERYRILIQNDFLKSKPNKKLIC